MSALSAQTTPLHPDLLMEYLNGRQSQHYSRYSHSPPNQHPPLMLPYLLNEELKPGYHSTPSSHQHNASSRAGDTCGVPTGHETCVVGVVCLTVTKTGFLTAESSELGKIRSFSITWNIVLITSDNQYFPILS